MLDAHFMHTFGRLGTKRDGWIQQSLAFRIKKIRGPAGPRPDVLFNCKQADVCKAYPGSIQRGCVLPSCGHYSTFIVPFINSDNKASRNSASNRFSSLFRYIIICFQ